MAHENSHYNVIVAIWTPFGFISDFGLTTLLNLVAISFRVTDEQLLFETGLFLLNIFTALKGTRLIFYIL